MAACPLSSLAGTKTVLDKAYSSAWKGARAVSYVVPSAAELKTMQRLFVRLLKGEPASRMATDLRALGWTVSTEKTGDLTWTIVAEAGDQRQGRGLYAFSNKGRHAMQAPHVPSDKLTGQILLRYAEDAQDAQHAENADDVSPRALAWNTVPRRTADLADLDESYLIAFSRAFAQVYPAQKIFQLHGFDVKRRRSAVAAQSSVIVSSSHRNPPQQLKSAVHCMQQKIEKRTRLYGVDVSELGGTQNSVAHALRKEAYHGFVHVEMDLPLRERLADEPAQRRKLLACLGSEQ